MPRQTSPNSSSEGGEDAPSAKQPASRQTLVVRSSAKGASKRKRAETNGNGAEVPARSRQRTEEPSSPVPDRTGRDGEDPYDPDQPVEERRALQRGLRNLQKDLVENPEQYLEPESDKLLRYFEKSGDYVKDVKQTSEAAIDSRSLLIAADLSAKRAHRLTAGNVVNGVDVDELVSKCITYMRHGGGIRDDEAPDLSSTQRQRRRPARGVIGEADDSEDEVGDDGDMLNWAHLGKYACQPNIRRPGLSGFLLGPLSVEKKHRKIVKRVAPLRVNNLREVRPEVLRVEDVAKENNDLTATCTKILNRLKQVQARAQDEIETQWKTETLNEDQVAQLMDKVGLHRNGGIDLLRFIVNPKSFGQTVENMFYVSFLIRDGRVKVEYDEDDLPTLYKGDDGYVSKKTAQKHQAIMSIDMETWQDVIAAFDIQESMIPHRREEVQQGPGARGWYS